MQNRTLALLRNRLMRWTTRADAGLESLEARQMLSIELPEGASMVTWGGDQVASVTGSYILTYEGRLGSEQAELLAREAATRLGVQVESVRSLGRGGWAELKTTGVVTAEAASRVAREIGPIVGIEPNSLKKLQRSPDDPQFGSQWGLANNGQQIPEQTGQLGAIGADINATGAWDVTIGSRNVVIAVIDSGVDLQHPDLAANIWVNPGEVAGNGLDDDGNGFVDDVNGWDFGSSDSNPDADQSPQAEVARYHGTQVASAIAAVGNNGAGVTGVSWNSQLMVLKVTGLEGGLTTAAIVEAHDYATLMKEQFGINIVVANASYKGEIDYSAFSTVNLVAEQAAVANFVATGATYVTSAGNEGRDLDGVPIGLFPEAFWDLPGVITVASTDNLDNAAAFSNFGVRNVDVAAPGVNIWMATEGGGYVYGSGTSYSAAIVSGIAALVYSVKPNASGTEVREA
ncbi:MAG: S8 family peptidase, partial [Phycisphaerales bacterium]